VYEETSVQKANSDDNGDNRAIITKVINICYIEIKWDDTKLKYDAITRWGEYK